MTGSMQAAIDGPTAAAISSSATTSATALRLPMLKDIAQIIDSAYENDRVTVGTGDEDLVTLSGKTLAETLESLEKRMKEAAANLEFEEAARLRDELHRLEHKELEIGQRSTSATALSARERYTQPNRPKAKPRKSKGSRH